MNRPRRRPPIHRPSRGVGRRGQSLVEFGLLLPVLLLLVAGSAQIGALIYTGVIVDNAARDGARVASEQPKSSGAYNSSGNANTDVAVNCPIANNPVCTTVANSTQSLSGVQTSLEAVPCPSSFSSCSPPGDCSNVSGNPATYGYIEVTVSDPVPIFVPIIGSIFSSSGQRTMTATVTMRIEPCTMTQGA